MRESLPDSPSNGDLCVSRRHPKEIWRVLNIYPDGPRSNPYARVWYARIKPEFSEHHESHVVLDHYRAVSDLEVLALMAVE